MLFHGLLDNRYFDMSSNIQPSIPITIVIIITIISIFSPAVAASVADDAAS